MATRADPPAGTSDPRGEASARPAAGDVVKLTAIERDLLIRSVVSSQALEGLYISYEEAALLLDQVLREPLPRIGE